jgi:cyclopropane-fatty-acyl-phospholipid synthase
MSLRDHLLKRLEARLGGMDLPLGIRLWDGTRLDLGRAPTVVLTLHKRGVLWQFLRGDVDRLGQSYVEGDLTVDGDIHEILVAGIALAERIGSQRWIRRLAALRPRRGHSRATDAQWVRYHYDVSNEFYALWLDRRMVYSCAYFMTGEEDIHRAQEQKLDHLCRKLRLKPGERLLDIGCGWGGLLGWAAERYGVEAVGVTLSEPQLAFARKHLAEAGLGGRVELRLQDYRDIPGEGAFDKIVSVGMYEHVGRGNLPLYFATLRRLLRTGGMVLNHGITTGDPEGGSSGPPGGGFIDRYVFPGGELPHISQVLREMARAGLDVVDVESLRPHYAATLLRWVKRLEAAREQATALAGAERYRIWRIYMAGCALAFDRGWLSLHQVLAGKPDAAGVLARPWTRRHQYVPEDEAIMAGPLPWRGLE